MEQAKVLQQIEAAAAIQLYLLDNMEADSKARVKDVRKLSKYVRRLCKLSKKAPHASNNTIPETPPLNEIENPPHSSAKGFDCLVNKLLSPSKVPTAPSSNSNREDSHDITFGLSLPPSPIRREREPNESFQEESCLDMLSSINDWGELKAYLDRCAEDSLDFEMAEREAVESVGVDPSPASPHPSSRSPKMTLSTPETLKGGLRARPRSRGALTPSTGSGSSIHAISPVLKTDTEKISTGGCAKTNKNTPRPLLNKMDLRQVCLMLDLIISLIPW